MRPKQAASLFIPAVGSTMGRTMSQSGEKKYQTMFRRPASAGVHRLPPGKVFLRQPNDVDIKAWIEQVGSL